MTEELNATNWCNKLTSTDTRAHNNIFILNLAVPEITGDN